jgi:guanylate kinase
MHGKLFIFTSPMGSGKGTLMRHAIEKYPELVIPYSYTTRTPRFEGDGKGHYRFISKEEFQQKIDAGEFLEWAEFSGNYYGTLKAEVEDELAAGKVLLKEIEAQGARQVKKIIPKDQLTVLFIDAGSWEELTRRALARAPMSEEELAKRRQRYEDELTFKPEADVIIHNRDGEHEQAKQQLDALITEAFMAVRAER